MSVKQIGYGILHYIKSVFFIGLFFIVMTIAEIPIILAEGDVDFPAVMTDYQAFQAMVVMTILVALFFVIRYRKQLEQHNPNQFGQSVVSKKKKIIVTLVMLVAYFVLDYVIQGLFPMNDSPENQQLIEESFRAIPLTISLMTCVFAPITEEYIFRGFFFNYFFNVKNNYMNVLAVFFSGLVFGLLHEASFTPALLVYASSGWVLGATYMCTKDLRCSMFIHFIGNTLATVMMLATH
ncbi:CPBP family intramembrane glutamic endopeptidase [Vagococcus xieshaowenii]|uniref:CPBP family intramembrane metalloprotease n=1 Tax=Vagococcus xieshaowenii TaxID=2562451 RepID=A0A4Z0DEM3_9ENTE|nr:CPBP family intramembrane glutamic endopeptidase [Vagococcus xieshaowenii]QCA29233.1 CPBP family intramembrane metalloprotease [Vagococcus xieshaowenii]TFZ43254.1 CPBP family intramembrane metalloprotease [Vagococcus xieshaowenii]